MEGLNPNNPPAKRTRIELKRWEYTDPVGTPHPDIVDVAVQIHNDSARGEISVIPELKIQWLEGAQSDRASAVWSQMTSMKDSPVRLVADESKTVRLPVSIAAEITALSRSERWPWSLRARVRVLSGTGKILGSTQLELPIVPAD